MMVMMMISRTDHFPDWKIYENPFYNPQFKQHQPQIGKNFCGSSPTLWDLNLFSSAMESELEFARTQILDLRSELEYERKVRKKMEAMNKKLTKELNEEKRGREAVERVCEQLAGEISSGRSEIEIMKKEMEEERKMLKMAEVIREERVQMKLTEAKLLFEEQLSEMADLSKTTTSNVTENEFPGQFKRLPVFGDYYAVFDSSKQSACAEELNTSTDQSRRMIFSEKQGWNDNSNPSFRVTAGVHRRASPEPENPHIKRGIKGFVEFPRVIRGVGSKSKLCGSKLEWQKAQLRILLKPKSPNPFNNFTVS